MRFNLAPIKSFALTISPYLGIRTQSFTVNALTDGRRIDGLPNIAFVGLRAGLAVDVPIIPKRLNVFGRFGIIPVFSSVTGPGNNAQYTIVEFVGVRLLEVKLTGSMSSKKVIIQPANVYSRGAIPGGNSGTSQFVYSPVTLVR